MEVGDVYFLQVVFDGTDTAREQKGVEVSYVYFFVRGGMWSVIAKNGISGYMCVDFLCFESHGILEQWRGPMAFNSSFRADGPIYRCTLQLRAARTPMTSSTKKPAAQFLTHLLYTPTHTSSSRPSSHHPPSSPRPRRRRPFHENHPRGIRDHFRHSLDQAAPFRHADTDVM